MADLQSSPFYEFLMSEYTPTEIQLFLDHSRAVSDMNPNVLEIFYQIEDINYSSDLFIFLVFSEDKSKALKLCTKFLKIHEDDFTAACEICIEAFKKYPKIVKELNAILNEKKTINSSTKKGWDPRTRIGRKQIGGIFAVDDAVLYKTIINMSIVRTACYFRTNIFCLFLESQFIRNITGDNNKVIQNENGDDMKISQWGWESYDFTKIEEIEDNFLMKKLRVVASGLKHIISKMLQKTLEKGLMAFSDEKLLEYYGDNPQRDHNNIETYMHLIYVKVAKDNKYANMNELKNKIEKLFYGEKPKIFNNSSDSNILQKAKDYALKTNYKIGNILDDCNPEKFRFALSKKRYINFAKFFHKVYTLSPLYCLFMKPMIFSGGTKEGKREQQKQLQQLKNISNYYNMIYNNIENSKIDIQTLDYFSAILKINQNISVIPDNKLQKIVNSAIKQTDSILKTNVCTQEFTIENTNKKVNKNEIGKDVIEFILNNIKHEKIQKCLNQAKIIDTEFQNKLKDVLKLCYPSNVNDYPDVGQSINSLEPNTQISEVLATSQQQTNQLLSDIVEIAKIDIMNQIFFGVNPKIPKEIKATTSEKIVNGTKSGIKTHQIEEYITNDYTYAFHKEFQFNLYWDKTEELTELNTTIDHNPFRENKILNVVIEPRFNEITRFNEINDSNDQEFKKNMKIQIGKMIRKIKNLRNFKLYPVTITSGREETFSKTVEKYIKGSYKIATYQEIKDRNTRTAIVDYFPYEEYCVHPGEKIKPFESYIEYTKKSLTWVASLFKSIPAFAAFGIDYIRHNSVEEAIAVFKKAITDRLASNIAYFTSNKNNEEKKIIPVTENTDKTSEHEQNVPSDKEAVYVITTNFSGQTDVHNKTNESSETNNSIYIPTPFEIFLFKEIESFLTKKPDYKDIMNVINDNYNNKDETGKIKTSGTKLSDDITKEIDKEPYMKFSENGRNEIMNNDIIIYYFDSMPTINKKEGAITENLGTHVTTVGDVLRFSLMLSCVLFIGFLENAYKFVGGKRKTMRRKKKKARYSKRKQKRSIKKSRMIKN